MRINEDLPRIIDVFCGMCHWAICVLNHRGFEDSVGTENCVNEMCAVKRITPNSRHHLQSICLTLFLSRRCNRTEG